MTRKLRKVKDLVKENRPKGVYVYYLISKGIIKRYKLDKCLAYDEDELANYKGKEGRPRKEK